MSLFSLGFGLTNRLSGYAEGYVFDREAPQGRTASFSDKGLIYCITRTLTIDATVDTGLGGLFRR